MGKVRTIPIYTNYILVYNGNLEEHMEDIRDIQQVSETWN